MAYRSVAGDTTRSKTPDDILRLHRHTLAAKVGKEHLRGVDAILASFPKTKQFAIREQCRDILEYEAKLNAILERIEEGREEPEVTNVIRNEIKERKWRLKRLAGDSTELLLEFLKNPENKEAFELIVENEDDIEDEEEARKWRRRYLNTKSRTFMNVEASFVAHNHPTTKGKKELWNRLETESRDDDLSYYERQQLRYGRARRGSTSIAGMVPLCCCI